MLSKEKPKHRRERKTEWLSGKRQPGLRELEPELVHRVFGGMEWRRRGIDHWDVFPKPECRRPFLN